MKILLTLFLILGCQIAQDIGPKGKVVRVKDGDTVVVLTEDQEEVTVRLTHIDAPERYQDFGNRSKQLLSRLCFGQDVVCLGNNHDRYGRILSEIQLPDGRIANQVMVDSGMAWHYKYYSSSTLYDSLENNARQLKRGLWSHPNPIPPWEYRRSKRE